MSWGQPEALYWLWSLPIVAVLWTLAGRSRRNAMAQLGQLAERMVSRRGRKSQRVRTVLWVLAFAACITAIAQPRWGFRWQELKREGLSMVVILDVSRSMAAEDVQPNRSERARREVLDLTELLAGDRVGLVLFAGGAYPRMPLTLDYGALQHIVRDSSPATISTQGSDLGAAIEQAAELLKTASDGDRTILLISDGEDQVGKGVEAARAAAAEGIHVYALGVGSTRGAPIPQHEGRFLKDSTGNVVLSTLEEDQLKSIAKAGQGAYTRSVAGSADIQALYIDEMRGRLKTAEQGVRREKIWNERYQWPLGAAVMLWLLSSLVGRTPRRSTAATGLALCVLALGPGSAQADDVDKLVSQQVAQPNDLVLAEQLGAALFKQQRYNEAATMLTEVADRTEDPTQRSRSRYNAGLAAYQSGRLMDAAQDWQRVLELDENHAGATQNLASVQKEISMRMGEPPQEGGDSSSDSGQPQDSEQQPSDTGAPQDPSEERSSDASQESDTATPPPPDLSEADLLDESDTGASSQATEPTDEVGSISEQEAARLFDGVDEGSPRMRARPASRGGNPW